MGKSRTRAWNRRRWSLLIGALVASVILFSVGVQCGMSEEYVIHPVGKVVKKSGTALVEIFPQFQDALLGLDGYSHVIVLYWFDRNDTPEKRAILRVHPRRNKANPLRGVFAARSPVRPNLIGFSVCKIEKIQGAKIVLEEIDAFDQTPVIDLKPYRPQKDCIPDSRAPKWTEAPGEK
jgi:tRNA (adenine37-N6)-methyltransferase